MKARLTGTAYADMERASEWYENNKPGPGLEFADRVLEAIDKIELNPFGYEKVIGDARKAELVQFPYSLRFKIQDDAMIIGCLHGRRDRVLARERAFHVFEV